MLSPLIFACAAPAQNASVNFTSVGTAEIAFDGASSEIGFTPDSKTGFDFQVASSNISGLVGDLGDIVGSFKMGPVYTLALGPLDVQEAMVTGTGALTISDGTPQLFSASVTWNAVTVFGTGGILDAIGEPNLSNFTYHGSNPALLLLSQQTIGMVSATFQFVPPVSLTDLADGNSNNSTTFSGSFEAIPEPGYTAAILGGFILLVSACIRRWRTKPILIPAAEVPAC